MPKSRAQDRHVRTRSTESTRPQRGARGLEHQRRLHGRMEPTGFGLPQRRVSHEGLEVALQVLTRHSAAPHLSSTLFHWQADTSHDTRRAVERPS